MIQIKSQYQVTGWARTKLGSIVDYAKDAYGYDNDHVVIVVVCMGTGNLVEEVGAIKCYDGGQTLTLIVPLDQAREIPGLEISE